MATNEFNYQLLNLQSSLERFALSLTSNPEEARDLLQETYLKALTYKDKFEESTNLKAWAFTIMRNTFINNYRRNVKRKTTNDSTDNQYYINQGGEHTQDTPEIRYSTNEITKKINQLSDEFRIPFQMHTQGFKYKEIAEELNLKIGTVKSRIFFSRQKLMKELEDYR
ncbi:MAG: sigma-70 family RNA polymerase sigma factor [Bacteroidales bacterium]|jgi:RNA polymerase sigma-70 factor (ECF subfamily)|nr:sigma-70 family RNA polymerase sigma factor [Bacteroidales bacterium]